MPAPGMLTPFSVPGKKSFFAVPPPGKPLEFPFFVLGWKGACLVLKAGFALCGVRPGEKGEGFFLSRGEWYQGSNPQEVGPGGGLVCLGADGKGNQGEVDSSKQSAGSGAGGWVSPAGAGGNPPHFRSPPRGGFEKGNFSLYPFLVSLSV